MRVLVACEMSGIVRDAFARRGHDAWSCDIVPTLRPGQHIVNDVVNVLDWDWDMMIAHPPCTYLTTTANRWMDAKYSHFYPDRPYRRQEAIEFFLLLASAAIDRIAIENPVGVMSTHYKPPTQIIQPYQHGHAESKATCLWLKNLPKLQPTMMVQPVYAVDKFGNEYRDSRGWRSSPTHHKTAGMKPKQRAMARSMTYDGIAEAMAEQWGTDAGLVSDLPLFAAAD